MSTAGIENAFKRKQMGYGDDRAYFLDRDFLDNKGIKVWRPAVGDNFLAIVPDQEARDGSFAMEINVHWNVGPNKGTYLCVRRMRKVSCPICELIAGLRDEGEDEKAKALEAYPPRFFMFVVDMKDKDTMALGPQAFVCPISIYEEMLELHRDKRTGQIKAVSKPQANFNFVFTREGTGQFSTNYGSVGLEKRETGFRKSWLDVPAYAECLYFADNNELKDALGGIGCSGDSDEIEAEEILEEGDEDLEFVEDGEEVDPETGEVTSEETETVLEEGEYEFLPEEDGEEEFLGDDMLDGEEETVPAEPPPERPRKPKPKPAPKTTTTPKQSTRGSSPKAGATAKTKSTAKQPARRGRR